MPEQPKPVEYLDLSGVAELLGVHPVSARRMRTRGKMITPDVMVGVNPGWAKESILEAVKDGRLNVQSRQTKD